ncbi:deoxynucleoside kinase [Candidatus Dependentiae bacterium]|nr:deoxynucleoside kinase [Candidatus Dependentiae bacterium]
MMTHKNQPSKLFILEGNIGAGKSTLLRLLEQNLGVDIINEPLSKWQTMSDQENLLDLFYRDTKRWAYTFQSYAFISRIQAILEQLSKDDRSSTKILERSVYSDRFCFAKNCFEAGLMSSLEWQIYQDWFEWLVGSYMPQPSGFIYLRTSPKVSHQRLTKRNRSEETSVTLEYLQSLHHKHENWLIHQNDTPVYVQKIPVLTLECDNEFETNLHLQRSHLQSINDFIAQVTTPIIPPSNFLGRVSL